MATIILQGSDYYEGADGVRRLYGPGLFNTNDAGQITGPHLITAIDVVDIPVEQQPDQTAIVDEVAPSQGGGVIPQNNGG